MGKTQPFASRYRQNTGPTPDWQPDGILRDMDRDGVDATVLFSNFALFATYTDNHEVALAHARVYNDWVAETYLPHSDRMRPLASIPTTDIGDAVKEVERCVRLGLRGLFLPEHPQPLPYHADEYEPLWACAEANGLPIFFHLAAGGANTKTGNSITGDAVKGILTAMAMGKDKELTNATLAARTMGWRTGTGQDPEWWMGFLQEGKSWEEQDLFGQLFLINERWPYDLKPSEYVKRDIRVQFADDRMAVQGRHITGVDTIYWGNDYPHAEGTFLGSQAVISEQMFDVPEADRAKARSTTGCSPPTSRRTASTSRP
jgi:hypothetical protein